MTAESWLQEMWERVRFSALEVPDDVNVIDLAGCAFLWVALIFLGFSYVAMPIMRSQVSPSFVHFLLADDRRGLLETVGYLVEADDGCSADGEDRDDRSNLFQVIPPVGRGATPRLHMGVHEHKVRGYDASPASALSPPAIRARSPTT